MTEDERKELVRQAKVGMRALVDEATGYQDERPDDDLARYHESLGGKPEEYRAPDAPEEEP